jgi:hypothetical protein
LTTLFQDEVGQCSFIDVLEEAVLRKSPVAVVLRDGTTFIDRVTDVVTENGSDFAVFERHARIATSQIRAMTRSRA